MWKTTEDPGSRNAWSCPLLWWVIRGQRCLTRRVRGRLGTQGPSVPHQQPPPSNWRIPLRWANCRRAALGFVWFWRPPETHEQTRESPRVCDSAAATTSPPWRGVRSGKCWRGLPGAGRGWGLLASFQPFLRQGRQDPFEQASPSQKHLARILSFLPNKTSHKTLRSTLEGGVLAGRFYFILFFLTRAAASRRQAGVPKHPGGERSGRHLSQGSQTSATPFGRRWRGQSRSPRPPRGSLCVCVCVCPPSSRHNRISGGGGGLPALPAGTDGQHPPGLQGAKGGCHRRPPPPVPREAAALPAARCHSPCHCHSPFRRYYQR